MDSLGIYISVPFCRSKCTYCNFASGVYPAALHERYVDRLCAEIESAGPRAATWGVELPRKVDSVYLGGGTPGILAGGLIGRLWDVLRRNFDIVKTAEITLECAPGQLEDAALDAMLEGGVNRISFGVQSFIDREAAVSGRLHTRAIALADLARVRLAGVEAINLDLIAGLPHQSRASWRESLETLVGTNAVHASIYMLEIDEESRLGRELLRGGSRYHASSAPGDDLTVELYTDAIARLEDHGLMQYEISNFARAGSESRHNRKYWRRQPYLGFGLDAHSMLRRREGAAVRFHTSDVLDEYLDAAGSPEMEELTRRQELEEAWFLGLRLREGVSWRALGEEFGRMPLEPFSPIVDELSQLDLLAEEGGAMRLTTRGMLFSNEVFARFLEVRP